MHLITGMLLARILGRKRGISILPLLRTGPIQTVHQLPGRIRFRIPCLTHEQSRASDLAVRLGKLDGVEQIEVTPTTGSLLIGYRPDQVRPELLFAALVRLLGLEEELAHPPQPVVVRELRTVLQSLNRAVYDRTSGLLDFSSALLILMAAAGVKKVIREGSSAMPPGFALLWWGAHQLLGHGET